MATNKVTQVTLNNIAAKIDTYDLSHETVNVTWTATMQHGSLLLANDTEAAAAAAATVEKVIDDPSLIDNDYQAGDVVQVNVAVQGNVFNTDALTFSDTSTVDPSTLTALAAKLNKFHTITNG